MIIQVNRDSIYHVLIVNYSWPLERQGWVIECNKRPMGHITNLSNNGHNKIIFMGRILLLGIMILTNKNLNYLKMLQHKLQPGWPIVFQKICSLYIRCKNLTPIVPQPYLRGSWFDHNWIITTWECFHTIESSLREDASTQVSGFMVNWFLRRRFYFIYGIYILRENLQHYYFK